MSNFFSFIKSKRFFVHLGLSLFAIALLLFLTLKWLSSYTAHNEFVVVPDFKGQSILKLNEFIADKQVNYLIIDSIYDPSEKKGIVLRQEPEPESKVKHNRIIYLYVTGMQSPQMLMPKLVDRSERQARLIIETYGLKLGKITEQSADCNGCVLAQSSGGKEISEGALVKKGSIINLVIGRKDSFFNTTADDSLLESEPNFE